MILSTGRSFSNWLHEAFWGEAPDLAPPGWNAERMLGRLVGPTTGALGGAGDEPAITTNA